MTLLRFVARTAFATAVVTCAHAVHTDDAAAQANGRVVSEEGEPLYGASVDVWERGRVIARGTTGSDGRFRIATAGDSAWLAIRLIGYAPRRLAVHSLTGVRDVALTRLPVHLAEVSASQPTPCPARTDPRSAGWWRSATARQRARMSAISYASRFSVSDARTARQGIGEAPSGESVTGQLGSSTIALRARALEMRDAGYAARSRGGTSSDAVEGARWRFVRLWALDAPLLADTMFLRRHHLGPREPSGWIRMCPSASTIVGLDGFLLIDDDSTLVQAVWHYAGGSFDEDAGATVLFAPGLDALLPAESRFWRSDDRRRYFTRQMRFDRWDVGGERDLEQLQRGLAR